MKNEIDNSFENIVQGDPTLNFLIREAKFDFDNLDHQVNLRCSAILLAIHKWIENKY